VQILGQSYTYWTGLKRDFLIYFPIEAGNIFSPERTPKDIRKQNSTGKVGRVKLRSNTKLEHAAHVLRCD
jgi:hypothetical protein